MSDPRVARRVGSERGITLVEVVVVGVLAVIVMLALTGFYINSQATWIDASTKAIAQRDASFMLRAISDSVHVSNSADTSTPGMLILFNAPDPLNGGAITERCRFWLASDSLIHEGVLTIDRGPLATSRVRQFSVTHTGRMVKVLALEVRSPQGRLIRLSTNAAFYN